jgi:hypothetical protein
MSQSSPGYPYFYRFNDFRVGSDIEFPELHPIPSDNTFEPHLVVRKGIPIPQITSPYRLQIDADRVLVTVPNVATFLVRGNNEIIVDAMPLAPPEDIRAYFFSCLAIIFFYRRNLLPFHAASVKWGDDVTLITGAAASGKSTLALGFFRRGCQVLNDDVTPLSLNSNGRLVTCYGSAYLKLPIDALTAYDYNTTSYEPVREGVRKFIFPVETPAEYDQLAVGRVIYLTDTNQREISIEQVRGLRKFELLRLSTCRSRLTEKLGKSAQQFSLLAKLAEVDLVQISRPHNINPATFSEIVFDKLKCS